MLTRCPIVPPANASSPLKLSGKSPGEVASAAGADRLHVTAEVLEEVEGVDGVDADPALVHLTGVVLVLVGGPVVSRR